MISLSIRRTLFDSSSELDRVPGITIPDWDDLDSVRLLRSIDYYEDAAFNYHLIAELLVELDQWRAYELERGDPEQRAQTIDRVREALDEAKRRRRYAIFLSL